MANMRQIIEAVKGAIAAAPPLGSTFASYAGPNLTESDFPIIVFAVETINVSTFMPGAAGAADQVTGALVVYHFTLSAEGTRVMHDLMEDTKARLHQQDLTADEWSSIQLRLVSRSGIEAAGEGMYNQIDTYNLIARGTL